jgi:hypothetical protein
MKNKSDNDKQNDEKWCVQSQMYPEFYYNRNVWDWRRSRFCSVQGVAGSI